MKNGIKVDQLTVETFETGAVPMAELRSGSSGHGCTVFTTCSPGCCDTTQPDTGD